MADDERPAVGTVAEEAARLLDALGGWAASAQAGYAAQSADAARPAGAENPSTGTGAARCATCGAENGAGQAVVCQLCPVCQGIGLLRSVRPETVDRLADLAGALAATLRDIAGQRRAEAGAAAPGGSRSSSSRSHSSASHASATGSRVHDIVVDDGDAPGSATS